MSVKTGRTSDQFMLRLPEGIRKKIADEARENGRSMNAELVQRIEDSFNAFNLAMHKQEPPHSRSDTAELQLKVADLQTNGAKKDDIDDMRSEIHSLRADVASDFLTTRKELSEQIVGLQRTIIDYIGELEARVRRIEQRQGVDET